LNIRNKDQIKLSVVIPFYLELTLISRAVESVLVNAGPVGALEILVCNDGPIAEAEIREQLSSRANAVTVVIENREAKGPGGARNTGLDASTGNYIAFLDADDFWLPGKVEAQLSATYEGATFISTAYRFDMGHTVVQPPETIDQALDIFLRRGIGTSTVMITRALLANLRFKDIRFAQDIDYWFRLARSPRFRYAAVDVCLVEYSTGGSTKNKWVQLQYLHKVLRINSVPWLHHVRVLSSYVLAGVYNHYIKRLFT
jgi:glycosyltransferase involved in cell wall biosynthesis